MKLVTLLALITVVLGGVGCRPLQADVGPQPTAAIPATVNARPTTPTPTVMSSPSPIPPTATLPATSTPRLADPTPTVRITSSPVPPTAAPSPIRDISAARDAIRKKVTAASALIASPEPQQRDQLTADLQATLRSYLEQVASLSTLGADGTARTDLARTLTLTPPTNSGAALPADQPAVDVVSIGPNQPALLLSYRQVGLPIFAAFPVGNQVTVTTLQPGPRNGSPEPEATVRLDRATDLTGDGRSELILTSEIEGASGPTTMVGILGWTGRGFAPLLTTSLSQWAGPADWQLAPNGSSQDVVVHCPAFGPFDHKLLAHPQLTRTFHWSGTRFTLTSATLTPAQSQRDAFNRAEVLYRAGDFANAIARYRVVVDDHSLAADQDSKTDWPALAWLRIGESQALLGDLGPAKVSLDKAVQAGGTIGSLAKGFRDALGQPDGAVRGFASLQASDLARRGNAEGSPGNLDFPVDPPGLVWPGLAISAYLQLHPEGATTSASDLKAALAKLGVDVADLVPADLNGDGHNEIVALLPVGQVISGWIVVREDGRWKARVVDAHGLEWSGIGTVEPRRDQPGQLVTLRLGGDVEPPDLRVGLTNGQPQFFAPDGTPLPQDNSAFPGQCSIAEALAP